jgi:hydrogenase nickel incorporation protein HypB
VYGGPPGKLANAEVHEPAFLVDRVDFHGVKRALNLAISPYTLGRRVKRGGFIGTWRRWRRRRPSDRPEIDAGLGADGSVRQRLVAHRSGNGRDQGLNKMTSKVTLEHNNLRENDLVATRLRKWLRDKGTLAINLISSPGCGKTTLLEKTLEMLPLGTRAAVLTGDLQIDKDPGRLGRYGYPARQIITAGACHLDARMVENQLADWRDERLDLLLIENVSNLVCPASYDLGEDAKIVLLSPTEGEDKPLKYPVIFCKAELMILNKIDLLPFVPFDAALAMDNARQMKPNIEIIETSCITGAGLEQWVAWLAGRAIRKKATFNAAATTHLRPILM